MKANAMKPNCRRDKAGTVAQAGALISAILASACCWLPILFIVFGVSGGALSAKFEALRPALFPVTFVFLGIAFYFTYRKPTAPSASANSSASGGACCSVPEQGAAETCCPPDRTNAVTLKKVNKVMLWVVTVFVLAFAFFPNYVGYLLGGGDTLAARHDLDKVRVKIEGMTCEACAANIENSLRKVPGVEAVEVHYDQAEALIGVPRGDMVPRNRILAAIAGAGNYTGTFSEPGDEKSRQ